MDIEDFLQAKNDNVPDVYCPTLDKYPNGYVDSVRVPMALTWVIETTIDREGITGENLIQIDVYVQSLAQGINRAVKKQCKVLRDLFIVEYSINTTNMFVSYSPNIKIIPGSIEFGAYRNVILAPDKTPFHGFIFTMKTEVAISEIECE